MSLGIKPRVAPMMINVLSGVVGRQAVRLPHNFLVIVASCQVRYFARIDPN